MERTVIRMKRCRGLMLFTAVICLLIAGSCGKESSEEQTPPKKTLKDIEVPLTEFGGGTTTISAYKGKVVVLSFWATWNKDCLELIDTMNSLSWKFRDKAVILGVALDDRGDHVLRRFIEEHNIQYPVFINGERTAKAFGGVGKLPATFIYRKDGVLFERIKGNRRKKYYEDRIINLILERI